MHNEKSPLANKTVKIKAEANELGGNKILIEDWWDRVAGKSWMFCDGNIACLGYAMRTALANPRVPNNDEVLYGKINGLGYLVHISELEQG
jgi:hypothetical protein